jgi:hypothetical protein
VCSLRSLFAMKIIHCIVNEDTPEGYHVCRYCSGKGYHPEEHEPIAHNAREMLEFLAGRMEYAGIGEEVAKSYARDIRLLLNDPNFKHSYP